MLLRQFPHVCKGRAATVMDVLGRLRKTRMRPVVRATVKIVHTLLPNVLETIVRALLYDDLGILTDLIPQRVLLADHYPDLMLLVRCGKILQAASDDA